MKNRKKVALITAGASGIGQVIAELFLANQWNVHICDINKDYIDKFLIANPNASASHIDVGSFDQVEHMFHELEGLYQNLDVLINNAGIAGATDEFENISNESWIKTLNININSLFYCTKLAIPLLKKLKSGSIINISSIAGLMGCPDRSPYVASKWAIIGLTKTLAMELGPFNINVNAICPGSVDGDRIERVISADAKKKGVSPEKIKKIYLRQNSLRKFTNANDISAMAYHLASKAGHGISGQAIAIDGNTEGLFNWLS
ncbi:MAG: SDR family oxidoreductase [Woeseiaceae bacterium]|nr:SDR family oxidoreductase [Woeseiaceae bacterium]MDG1864987.1 SDR family oxidoreductase [Woeseiaceae bacterium]